MKQGARHSFDPGRDPRNRWTKNN